MDRLSSVINFLHTVLTARFHRCGSRKQKDGLSPFGGNLLGSKNLNERRSLVDQGIVENIRNTMICSFTDVPISAFGWIEARNGRRNSISLATTAEGTTFRNGE